MDDQYCLKWASHTGTLKDTAYKFLEHESLVDVTLACQEYGQVHLFKAHQIILSACSSYFESLFLHNKHQHPIVFLKDVNKHELEDVLTFMYRGEVNVHQDRIKDVLVTAKSLMVRGLSDEMVICDSDSSPDNVFKDKKNLGFYHKRKHEQNEQVMSVEIKKSTSPECSGNLGVKHRCHSVLENYDVTLPKHEGLFFQPTNRRKYSNENPMDCSTASTYDECVPSSCCESIKMLNTVDGPRNIDSGVHFADSDYKHFSRAAQFNREPNSENETDCKSESLSLESQHIEETSSQEVSVIQSHLHNSSTDSTSVSLITFSPPIHGPKRVGHFQLKWMEIFDWLQYDKQNQKMFCKFCRKWGDSIPNIRRTSFVDGSCNFRFEIVKHHDCSKSHKICMRKDELCTSENINRFVT